MSLEGNTSNTFILSLSLDFKLMYNLKNYLLHDTQYTFSPHLINNM